MNESTEQLIRCEGRRRARYRGYSSRSDKWGRGFVTDPVACGLRGEAAFVLFINDHFGPVLDLDTALKRYGDGGIDFELFGKTFQVKGQTRLRDPFLVRRVSDRGNIVQLPADYVVFVTGCHETNPSLLGWMKRQGLCERGIRKKSPVGDHHNLEIAHKHFEPMDRLILWLERAKRNGARNL